MYYVPVFDQVRVRLQAAQKIGEKYLINVTNMYRNDVELVV